jgi:NADH-quinone oxidoreductase subunit C
MSHTESPIGILSAKMNERFANLIHATHIAWDELTVDVPPQHLHEVCVALRDEEDFEFTMLVDVCGVDYLQYGLSEWETHEATATGFERGVEVNVFRKEQGGIPGKSRFASVYHLLSITKNQRVRLKVFLDSHQPAVPSVVSIWPSANWFEREAFDLFGIHYIDHPDLRRLLTDYGFIGHPFRKDFPLIGNVEARYDATLKQVVYEPVSITPRVLEPKVIRRDNRYEAGE